MLPLFIDRTGASACCVSSHLQCISLLSSWEIIWKRRRGSIQAVNQGTVGSFFRDIRHPANSILGGFGLVYLYGTEASVLRISQKSILAEQPHFNHGTRATVKSNVGELLLSAIGRLVENHPSIPLLLNGKPMQ